MIACVLIPYFAAAVERREAPKLAERPLVIVTMSSDQVRVYAVSHEAAEVGVRAGIPLREAEALCPDARFIPASPTRYRRAFDQLFEILSNFTPRIEPASGLTGGDGSGRFYIDLERLSREQAIEMARRIGEEVRNESELAASISLASGKFTAHIAAASVEPGEALLIQPGHEADFLAPFPVSLLPLDKEMARRLPLLGIRRLGQLAKLPPAAVLAQFGKSGRYAQRLAQGRDARPVVPCAPQAAERLAHQFEDPVGDLAILNAVLQNLAEKLAGRLRARGYVARRLAVILHLEDGATREDGLVLRQPAVSAGHISRTLNELLDRMGVPCRVLEVEVLADLSPAMGRQLALFISKAEQERRLREALGNLVARYGPEVFYWVNLSDQDSLLPERRFHLHAAVEAA